MSIARLLHEFRPLFRMLEEPLRRGPVASYGFPQRSLLSDPFLASSAAVRPAVDIIEEGDKYVVEAELPGVKKENVDITVGDGGHSVTIQGRTFSRQEGEAGESAPETGGAQGEGAVVKSDASSNQLTAERWYSGSASFTRTVWLPQPVDPSKVQAKLSEGILTLKVPKAEDKETVKVNVE
ncbi:HSP20-like chaperone [Melanogaster broomeanus]|nr:HSP20-like chaperone [Melanogaster broomeanus]